MKKKTVLILCASLMSIAVIIACVFLVLHVIKASQETESMQNIASQEDTSTENKDNLDEEANNSGEDEDSDNNEYPIPVEPQDPNIYYSYSGEIPHIFTHCLIAYPELKGGDGNMRYDTDCINVTEFKNLLEELYRNGYSLVDIHDTFTKDASGKYVLVDSIEVPIGRKPLIFSVDDVVYDVKKRGNGMVDFLTIDENGDIVTGTYQKDGSISYSRENEFIPILEDFIKEHPDFSSHGARITLCMTGFTGQFGYRTDADYEGDRASEIRKAKEVADRLKEMGYTFACHGYGHYNATSISLGTMETDIRQFQEEVVPIIGEVSVYVYPYGKNLVPGDAKYQALVDNGFVLFCSVSHQFFARDYEDGASLYMTRIAIDGYSLRNYKTALSPVINVDNVIDLSVRLPRTF